MFLSKFGQKYYFLEKNIFSSIHFLGNTNWSYVIVTFHNREIWHDYNVSYRGSRPEVLCKKVFLEISQNSQENTSARVSFLIKLQALGDLLLQNTLVAASEVRTMLTSCQNYHITDENKLHVSR